MRSGQVRRLPVIDSEGCLVGIVSLNDFARLAEQETGRKNRDLSAAEDLSSGSFAGIVGG